MIYAYSNKKNRNSLGNIIPATYIKQLGLVVGSDIEVKSDGNKLIIELVKHPKKHFPFSEMELLTGLDAHTAHADELAIIFGKELGE